jgi:hypothetical protein
MIKRKGKSQIGNLTPDNESLESRGVLYTVGKIFSRAIIFCLCTLKTNLL